MKSMLVSIFVVLIGILLISSRSNAQSSASGSASSPAEVQLQVYVDAHGAIYADGVKCSLSELRTRLESLKAKKGSVNYFRANPAGEPLASAMKVIKLIVEIEVPVRLVESEKQWRELGGTLPK